MWLYRTSGDTKNAIVLYNYQSDRKMKRPAEFLKGFKGYLHTDGYEAYHSLGGGITVIGCWSHAQRKFDEALKSLTEKDCKDSHALRGKQYCDQLFMLEREFAHMTPQDCYKKRQERSKPLLEAFYQWATTVDGLPGAQPGRQGITCRRSVNTWNITCWMVGWKSATTERSAASCPL